jgi:hypothetical protein
LATAPATAFAAASACLIAAASVPTPALVCLHPELPGPDRCKGFEDGGRVMYSPCMRQTEYLRVIGFGSLRSLHVSAALPLFPLPSTRQQRNVVMVAFIHPCIHPRDLRVCSGRCRALHALLTCLLFRNPGIRTRSSPETPPGGSWGGHVAICPCLFHVRASTCHPLCIHVPRKGPSVCTCRFGGAIT